MQWNQIKTLFILCFLILDVYLLIQFIDKQEQTDLGLLEHENATIEQKLEAEDITLPDLPENDEEEEEFYISVSPRKFSDDDLSALGKLENQSPIVIDDRFIVSRFKDPVPIEGKGGQIAETVKETILFPDDYVFWDWNEELNVLIFFQEKSERPIYYNQNGIIFVFLNDENEATFYTQTMLDKSEANGDKYTLIKPIKSIETLYNSNDLKTGDDVTKVDIGFHTRIPLESGVQVFAPTWRVTVNGEQNFFVNALEGSVFSSKDITFLEESLESIAGKVQAIEDESIKKEILDQLHQRLEVPDGSELEQ